MIANAGKSAGRDVPMDAGLTAGDVSGMLIVREDNTEFILEAIDRALAEAMDEIGAAMQEHAQQLCPVDTGRLRNSITYRLGGGGYAFPGYGAEVSAHEHAVSVGSDVEYAAYVELGTSRTRAQPFLEPAAARFADEYRSMVESHLSSGD